MWLKIIFYSPFDIFDCIYLKYIYSRQYLTDLLKGESTCNLLCLGEKQLSCYLLLKVSHKTVESHLS